MSTTEVGQGGKSEWLTGAAALCSPRSNAAKLCLGGPLLVALQALTLSGEEESCPPKASQSLSIPKGQKLPRPKIERKKGQGNKNSRG